jgi:hypothetical protein
LPNILDLYREGYEMIEICEECRLAEEDIIRELQIFKESSMIMLGKTGTRFKFNDEFKSLIVDRYLNCDVSSSYAISQDLNVRINTITKYLEQAGIERNKGNSKPTSYEVIEWDNFYRCPDCESTKNVRRLSIHNQESKEEENHSFCTSCNTEWYKEDGETRKVFWGMIK